MKRKMALVVMAVFITLLFANVVYAATPGLKIHHRIRVTLIVPSNISMNLEDEWVHKNLQKPEAEAFSELKESGILVDKLKEGKSTVWLLTKTE